MTSPDIVSLFDVDNTLVDNDRIQDDLRKHLERESGRENRDRTGRYSNSCAANWVMQTISALFRATAWQP